MSDRKIMLPSGNITLVRNIQSAVELIPRIRSTASLCWIAEETLRITLNTRERGEQHKVYVLLSSCEG
jgi:hypothetical protein